MIYVIFCIIHFILDFGSKRICKVIEENKFLHCLTYTAGFAFVFYLTNKFHFLKINYLWLLLIFFSHFVIDKKVNKEKLFGKFKKHLKFIEKFQKSLPEQLRNWLKLKKEDLRYRVFVALEQIMHLLVLLVILVIIIIYGFN